jgi:hypothetical protein
MLDLAVPRPPGSSDDPRRLRDVLARTAALALEHRVPSVLVGFAGSEGDRVFPDFVAFVESELRVEDSVFRLTRDRAVLFLADVDPTQAGVVVERLVEGFWRELASVAGPRLQVRYLEVPTGTRVLAVKDVLPALFGSVDEAEG